MSNYDLTDYFLFVLMAILSILFVVVLGSLLFYGIDSSFLPQKETIGVVVKKAFTPAHTETILMYNAATKTSLPQTSYYPDDWSLKIKFLKKEEDSISVNHIYYDKVDVGSQVTIKYVIGRFSRKGYIKSVVE